MRFTFLLNCLGIGDLIALSSVARSLQAQGHSSVLCTAAITYMLEAATHVEGFDDFLIYSDRGAGAALAKMLVSDRVITVDYDLESGSSRRVESFLGGTGLKNIPILPPVWHVSPAELEVAKAWLKSVGLLGRQFVYLAPKSSKTVRQLDPGTFAAIHDMLWDRGLPVVVGLKDDLYLGKACCRREVLDCSHFYVGVAAGVLSLSSLVLSVDTAAVHIGAATSTPVLGAFGPFGFDRVCGTYSGCSELYYRRRLDCYDCVLGCADRSDHKQLRLARDCNLAGCEQIKQVDPARAVEQVCSSVMPDTQASVSVNVSVKSRKTLKDLYEGQKLPRSPERRAKSTIIVTAGTRSHTVLAQLLSERIRGLSGAQCLDLSSRVDWQVLRHPSWVKAYLWDLVDLEVDRILWLDTDVFPLRGFPGLPEGPFAAAPALPGVQESDVKALPAVGQAAVYFNAGVLAIDRSTIPIFNELKDRMSDEKQGLCWDQSWLNAIVGKVPDCFTELAAGWNWCVRSKDPPEDCWIAHFASYANKEAALLRLYGSFGASGPATTQDVLDALKERIENRGAKRRK